MNGRLKCSNVFNSCYNPHTLSDDIKSKLNPPTTAPVDFLYLDYRNMEVSVLQWLSGDDQLKKIIDSGEDVYAGIWKYITKLDCTGSHRNKCKSIFLPVIYGQGAESVAKRADIPEKTAIKLVDRLYKGFPIAFDWVKQQQANLDENNFAQDYFGRRRQFNDQQYRVRNFVVQAAASTVCLHKLIKLYESIEDDSKIVFHVHDGYGMLVRRQYASKLAKKYVAVLEQEEDFYPGLKLRISCKIGGRLNKLTPI